MAGTWQNVAVVGIVLAAALYLAWRAWRRSTSKGRPGCRTCSTCGARPDETVVVHFGSRDTKEEPGQ